jgi:hypothetical protein
MRFDSRTMTVHLAATTLGRVGTVLAQRKLLDRGRDDLLAGVMLRATAERADGGGALVWKHAGKRHDDAEDLGFELGLEGYGGSDGPGGRVLLGASW